MRRDSPSVSPPRMRPSSPGVSPPREKSVSPPRAPPTFSSYSNDDDLTLANLYCEPCDVRLHDRDSMLAHLKGRPHLSQQQRLRDRDVRNLTGGRGISEVFGAETSRNQYSEDFWKTNKGQKALLPDQERFLDEKRLDKKRARFDSRSYDYAQYKPNQDDLYCDICDVWVKSRDVMESHKGGQNHKRRAAQVKRFRCDMCHVEVPCQDTLDKHMMGKDHIKREKQLQEKRKERGEVEADMGGYGFKTGPREMNKLSSTEREELEKLRQSQKFLQAKVKELSEFKAQCIKNHGTEEVKELRDYKKWCQETHIRPREFSRPGLFCKKEEPSDDFEATTSHGHTRRYTPSIKGEYVESKDFKYNARGGLSEYTYSPDKKELKPYR